MTADRWTAASDVVLALGNLVLAILTLGLHAPLSFTWTVTFVCTAAAALLGAVYHATDRPWKERLWTVTSGVSTACYLLFLVCAAAVTRPGWSWLAVACPLAGACGFAIGVWIAARPFYYVSVVAALVAVASAVMLLWSPFAAARAWIYAGLAVTVAGVVLQKVRTTEGPLNNNVVFHGLQLLANVLVLFAARAAA